MVELSYVMVKPEFATNEQIIKDIKQRLISAGLKIVEQNYVKYDVEHARQHYQEHIEKDFYPNLEKCITSDKSYGMIVSGENAISKIRALVGSTKKPEPNTIRYDIPKKYNLELRITQNVVHASDSVESAKREIDIFKDLIK